MPRAVARTASITERVDRLKELRGEHRSVTPPLPRSVKLELTTRCNYGCFFCSLTREGHEGDDMPWPLYTRLAQEIRALGVTQVGLFYIGESFLYERLAEAVRYAKRDCGYPYVFLTTNGALATAERVRELMLAGLDSLKFALNFATPAQMTRYAGASADTLDTVLKNVKDACAARDEVLKETGRRCNVYASSLLFDADQPQRTEEALGDILGMVDQHYWLPLYGRALPYANDHAAADDALNILSKPIPCWGIFTEAHITVDGGLSACSLDHGQRFRIADLKQCSFAEAWHSPAYQALRKAHLQQNTAGTMCERCIGYDPA